MKKKCTICFILLDIPCVSFGCHGHHNESVGNVCVYCTNNERANVLFLHTSPALLSSLEDFEVRYETNH